MVHGISCSKIETVEGRRGERRQTWRQSSREETLDRIHTDLLVEVVDAGRPFEQTGKSWFLLLNEFDLMDYYNHNFNTT